ncbi:MAG: 30S ribosomal protein S28e [Candidatus Nanoarchaeia archaeon]
MGGGEVTPAQILEIVGSMGTREGGKQVRVKILAGKDAGKVMRRNVIGPFKIGDILMLKETEIEASPLKGRKG